MKNIIKKITYNPDKKKKFINKYKIILKEIKEIQKSIYNGGYIDFDYSIKSTFNKYNIKNKKVITELDELDKKNEQNKQKSTEIIKTLKEYNIDTSEWGKGDAKTIDHFIKEIIQEESILLKNINELIREVNPVFIDIYYLDKNGNKYKLKEDKQIFKDGRERKRNMPGSIGEKLKPNESTEDCVKRALSEELGISFNGNIEKIEETINIEEAKEAKTYPGIKSKKITTKYKVYINESDYKENGYVENQEDKDTYFIWEKVSST